MKKVFNNSELSHVWAAQTQNEGRAGSFYFNGKTIYSYGSHFPIATMEENDVFFTKRTYSNTTAKHITLTRQAISHKNIIYCYDVPVNLKFASSEHENNLNRWKKEIKILFNELGNKKIRNTTDRINGINNLISELTIYCNYFKLTVKDKELKNLLSIAKQDDFLQKAREAKDKQNEANNKLMQQAVKSYEIYLKFWRANNNEAIQSMTAKQRALCNFYLNNEAALTRLRYNNVNNRLETSKGVQIPAEIAKKAYTQLNNCMAVNCKDLSIPVLHYTITETTKDTIKAGCHTIPKTDIIYVANLLNW